MPFRHPSGTATMIDITIRVHDTDAAVMLVNRSDTQDGCACLDLGTEPHAREVVFKPGDSVTMRITRGRHRVYIPSGESVSCSLESLPAEPI